MVDIVTDYESKGATDENDEEFIKIKENIEDAHEYFATNYETYNKSRNYVYNTTLDDSKRQRLLTLGKPPLEFNEIEVNLSRMVGEWVKHEPSINLMRREGSTIAPATITFLQDHLRYIIHQANKNDYSKLIYEEMISGGFSGAKVTLKYPSPKSMAPVPCIEKLYDPTLSYFDPIARESSKHDGNYCGELFPFPIDEFTKTFKKAQIEKYNIKEETISNFDNFTWSYKSSKESSYILVADHYEKEKEEKEIIQISTGDVLFMEDYEKLMRGWKRGPFGKYPKPKATSKPQTRLFDKITQYLLWEYGILMKKETVYRYLPIVYFDGNSKILSRNPKGGESFQKTRPVFYQAMGLQDLKNLAGQSAAQWIQNLTTHKWIIKEEALPTDAQSLLAIKNPQIASTLMVKAFLNKNPDVPIPEPIREVVNVPLPPEVLAAFQGVDPMFQMVLGGFATNMGKPDSNLSGKAIIETQAAGNPAAMPSCSGYLNGLTQVAAICVDLIPKCYKSEMSLPVKSLSGKFELKKVNAGDDEEAPQLNYDSYDLDIIIEPSLSFQVQKEQAIMQLITLMKTSPAFEQMMNSPMGLPILIKNLTMYGADELREMLPEYEKYAKQKQQEAMEAQKEAMMNDPRMITAKASLMKAQADTQNKQIETQVKVMEMQQDAQMHSIDSELKSAEIGVKQMQAQADVFKAQAEMAMTQMDVQSRISDDQTSQIIHSLDAAAKMAETENKQAEHALKVHAAALQEQDMQLKEMKASHDMTIAEHKAQTDRIKANKPAPKPKGKSK